MSDAKKTGQCSSCDGLVSKTAQTCPHCGQAKPYKKLKEELAKERNGCLILILAVCLLFGACVLSADEQETPEVWQEGKAGFEVSRDCRERILESLKAPSTAKIHETFNTYKGSNVYLVKFEVDAQNSFGAMIRSNFECKITEKIGGGNVWQDVQLNEY